MTRRFSASGSVGALAATDFAVVEIGKSIFETGGNAVDAAVASVAAMFATAPYACGFGGDAMILIDASDGSTAINGSGPAPNDISGALGDMPGRSVAVPGAADALEIAQRQFGNLTWARVLDPAIRLAEEGVRHDASLALAIARRRNILAEHANAWLELAGSGRVGALYRQPHLASTLRRVAREGARALRQGLLAEAIVRSCRRGGGSLSRTDLQSNRIETKLPIVVACRGAELIVQPPVSQAILGAMALRATETLDVRDPNERIPALVAAVRTAFRYRDDIAERSVCDLLAISRPHTAAVAASDRSGTVACIVVSLFDDFGCGIFVPEGGFFLNNRLDGFARSAKSPNARAPGRLPIHTLAPVIVRQRTRRWGLVTPGADGQVQFTAQILDAVLAGGISLRKAITIPRWRSVGERVAVEMSFDITAAGALSRAGCHTYSRHGDDGFFGSAAIAGVTLDGTPFAEADRRGRAGAVAAQ
jgi:gamma-glutamyltranspeptidase/glutathione hydrolase